MTSTYSLGLSPCPNDTFAFHALLHGKVPCDISLDVHFADIEQLNQLCLHRAYHFSKISFSLLALIQSQYAVLDAGSALGKGCGPLLITRDPLPKETVLSAPIAVPGLHTTAVGLLRLWAEHPLDLVPLPFDQIIPRVRKGEFQAGLIIHESRFTYAEAGLHAMVDLGNFWERETGLPIPLGGIAVRRDVPAEVAQHLTHALQQSIRYAQAHPQEAIPFMQAHAQEMDPHVMQQHVALYVNDHTLSLGPQGQKAIETLMHRANPNAQRAHASTSLFCAES